MDDTTTNPLADFGPETLTRERPKPYEEGGKRGLARLVMVDATGKVA